MPIFQYKGYQSDGREVLGTIEADGLKDALAKVKDAGVFPKDITEYIHRKRRPFFQRYETLLPAITRQLSILLSSGIPIVEALRSLAEENKGFWKGLLVDIRDRVSQGASLSRAMAEQKGVFPEFYINMVEAGEAGGALGDVLSRLADFLERQSVIKHRVRVAMIYPTFVVCAGFVVLLFLFTFVIPKIVKIFEDTKATLPFITIILITLSNLFKGYWWIVAGVVVGGIIGFKRLREKNPLLIDRILMKAPGNIIQGLYLFRFTRTLGFLLGGGLPILKALELSSKSIGNRFSENAIREAQKKVAEGASLSSSLDGFPPSLLQLISVGEKSGRLAEVLHRVADAYEEEFSRKVQKALSLLEPSMILLMGIVVGFIVLAVLLPIFQLNQLVR